MPPKHRAFLEALEKNSIIRNFVQEKLSIHQPLRDAYNACVEWIEKFRSMHLEYAHNYIDKQQQASPSNPTKVGTGGTPLINYLKKHRDETAGHKLQ